MIEGSFLARDEEDVGPHGVQILVRELCPRAEGLHESAQIVSIPFVVKTIREVLNHGVNFRCSGGTWNGCREKSKDSYHR